MSKNEILNGGELKSHLKESAKKLGLWYLPIFVKVNYNAPPAGTFYFGIYINSKILEMFDKEEQFAIIDHELGHIKRWKEDCIVILYILLPLIPFFLYYLGLSSIISIHGWLYISITLWSIFLILRFPLLNYVVSLKRNCEYGADRVSAETLGNAKTLISTIRKWEGYIETQQPQPSKIYELIHWCYFSNRNDYPSTDERIKAIFEK